MALLKKAPRYGGRTVEDWLDRARGGDLLLPSFQRNYVWTPSLVAEYVKALLENRPTGIFLILESAHPLPFRCRHLGESELELDQHTRVSSPELVLDGQQRLTSLWTALHDEGRKRRYIIWLSNWDDRDPVVEKVEWRSPTWSNPAKMYRDNAVPVDVLGSTTRVSAWCREAAGEHWHDLYERVAKLRERLVVKANLQYCSLGKDTSRDAAVDIFINVNRSAVKLKPVDIAVAIAEADCGVNLREHVQEHLERSSELSHYFKIDAQKGLIEVAEWMIKVACLKVRESDRGDNGLPPSQIHYPSAIRSLCGADPASRRPGEARARIQQLQDDMDAALRLAASCGGPTKRTLPSWPPIHVVAALQEDVRNVGAHLQDEARQLLATYVWRGFATDRYNLQAQARLLEDYRGLRRHLRELREWRRQGNGPKPEVDAPVFDEAAHPVADMAELLRAGWIGGTSRLGRAITAAPYRANRSIG